jgi:hypothetical protein
MGNDEYGKISERTPRSGLYRRRERFVLPMWAWPVLGTACLLLGVALGYFLWESNFGQEPPAPTPTALVVVVTATPLAAQPTVTAAPEETATVAPSPAPTETLVPTIEPTPAMKISVGGKVKVQGTGGSGVRMRAGPGLDFVTFKSASENAVLEVLGGPETADEYTWWRLKDDTGTIGWAADEFLVAIP